MNKDKKKKSLSYRLFWPIRNEKWQPISIPVASILISFIAAAIVILLLGKNPLQAFYNLFQGAGIFPKSSYAGYKSILTDFLSLLNAMTPLVFASLAVAVALRAGLFNIGVSGQMLVSGFLATVIVGYSGLDAIIAKPLVLLVGIVAGGLMGGLVGWLKYRFNIHEVVSTIMLNYIAQYVISFFIQMYYVDPVSRQSKYISEEARLTLVNVEIANLKMDIPLGFILAIIIAILIKFLMDKTVVGFEIKAVGSNRKAAKYTGINVGRNTVLAMIISGGLAGLAGVTYYLGYFSSIQPKVLSSIGFDSIAVALLGNAHPIGIIFSSFLVSIIDQGSTYMSSQAGIRQEIASVIIGLILLFSACGAYVKHKVSRLKEKEEDRKDSES
ncbi:nucleoside ABC transporter membrane protein [Psychrobacillus sp. OK028]|uniref:ABC transporter permease n=1 Tax=Psychrobacillus sp. OK028 TaxID=1884359 RepID=UPI000891434F|nr:ABC transporter permease [Psychrobacillus sp. OK028]SDN73088.1 nucleoside ABC transporter membrane protein [Psychrobacillus sp. OK028]